MSGDQVVCGYDAVNPGQRHPERRLPAPRIHRRVSAGPRISCRYNPTASNINPGNTTCTPFEQPTTAAMSRNGITCAYDATPTSSVVDTSCTWDVSATAATPKTTCAYSTGSATTVTKTDDCTVVTQDTGTANTTVWHGRLEGLFLPLGGGYHRGLGRMFGHGFSGRFSTGRVALLRLLDLRLRQSRGHQRVFMCRAPGGLTGGPTRACTYLGTPSSVSAPLELVLLRGLLVAAPADFSYPAKTCSYDAADAPVAVSTLR